MLQFAVVLVALLALSSSGAGAQCRGDFDEDGRVTVSELVTAVNNALRGCPCPFVFSDDTGDSRCEFAADFRRSLYSAPCATFPASWRSDGTTMLITLQSEPPTTIVARVASSTRANVTGYQTGISPQVYPAIGSIDVREDGFRLEPGAPGWFNVDGCQLWSFMDARY